MMLILRLFFILVFTILFGCFDDMKLENKLYRYAEDDFLKNWVALSPKPINDDLYSVHFMGNAVVASMYGGKILYSDNAMMTLEYYNLPQTDVLNDIGDFSGSYVGVSSSGKIYKSLDGKKWSLIPGDPINKPLTAVATGDKVVAVGFEGLIVSLGNLNTYTKKSSGTQSHLYDIAVSDSNRYVAVGQNSIVCTSSDGDAFTCSTTSVGADIISIAYGNNKFIAVASNNKFMSSSDGMGWAIYDLGFSGTISRIEYLNDEFIIYGLNGYIATSKTGISFKRLSISSQYNLFDATYDGSLYYFVGPGGLVLTSSYPSSGFFRISPDIAGDLFALYKGNEYYVVSGSGGTVAYSNDGVDFIPVGSTKINNDIIAVTSNKDFNNEIFCAVGKNGFAYKTNDVTGEWTGYQVGNSGDFNDITYALSKFIIAGDSGAIYISGDCTSFLRINQGFSANFKRVFFDGTNILVVGSGGSIYKSTNPSGPYSKITFPNSYDIVDISFGNGFYLVLTQEKVSATLYNSRIFKSNDLSSFVLAKEYSNIKLTRVAFGGGYFIFSSSFGNIYYTKDGQNFMVTSTGKYKEILNATFIDRSFYLSGKDSLLLKSGDNLSGLEPQISVSRDAIIFADTIINASSDMEEIVVSNVGDGSLSINTVRLGGTNSNQFSIITDSCSTAVLPKGDVCKIYVDFRPTSVGSKSAVLEIISNDKKNPTYSVSLSGKGISPTQGAISVDRQKIDFGLVKVGMESQPQSVLVTNVGTKDLSISDVYLDGNDIISFEIKSDNCKGKSIVPNSTCTISLSFKPQSLGNKDAELHIDSDDPTKPTVKVILSGSGIDINYPNITVDKQQIDFGIVKVGTESASQSLTVSNSGSSLLVISDVKTDGANAADFVIKSDDCKGKSIVPSSSCKINIVFKPQTAGNAIALLKISSNDPDTPDYSVNLYGTGRAPGGPAIDVKPLNLDFGKVNVGVESSPLDIVITSVGDSDLSISSENITGDYRNFRIAFDNCGVKLPPSQSCKISISFVPKSSGAKSATLQIGSNDPINSVVNVNLSGEGVINKPSEISVTPSSYDFGKKIIGKTYPSVTFTVKNEGTGNLIVDSVFLEGEDAEVFKINSDDCSGNQFAPDGLCYIKISFDPKDEKLYSVNLTINSNDLSTPELKVPIKGEGIREESKDAGTTYDISISEDSNISSLTDAKSTDTSESGCGCSIIE